MGVLVVITNTPSRGVALRIAQALVERRLAACVNILAECTSVYRWQGKLENESEIPLLIKTRSEVYDEVQAVIKELHPYELPEVIAVPVERGLPGYLDWVNTETISGLSK